MAERFGDDAAVDARGHVGRDGRKPLAGARVRLCRHGRVHFYCVLVTTAEKDAGFDRQPGRSQQHHGTTRQPTLPLTHHPAGLMMN